MPLKNIPDLLYIAEVQQKESTYSWEKYFEMSHLMAGPKNSWEMNANKRHKVVVIL